MVSNRAGVRKAANALGMVDVALAQWVGGETGNEVRREAVALHVFTCQPFLRYLPRS